MIWSETWRQHTEALSGEPSAGRLAQVQSETDYCLGIKQMSTGRL